MLFAFKHCFICLILVPLVQQAILHHRDVKSGGPLSSVCICQTPIHFELKHLHLQYRYQPPVFVYKHTSVLVRSNPCPHVRVTLKLDKCFELYIRDHVLAVILENVRGVESIPQSRQWIYAARLIMARINHPDAPKNSAINSGANVPRFQPGLRTASLGSSGS